MHRAHHRVAGMAIGLIALLVSLAPSQALAADALERTRSGFSPEIAVSLSTGLSSLPEERRAAGGSFGSGIEFALGGFVTNRLSIHMSGHYHYLFSEGAAAVVALNGPRATYYMRDKAPSWHMSVSLGAAFTAVLEDPSGLNGATGASFAVGYEFKPHHSVELEVFVGPEDPGQWSYDSVEPGSLVVVCLSIMSSGYREVQ